MAGHVFVLNADLTRLACDAWALPTGKNLYVESYWQRGPDADLDRWYGDFSRWGDERVLRIRDLGEITDPRDPYFVSIASRWLDEKRIRLAATEFLDKAAEGGWRYLKRRDRPLYALPALGTGRGGGRHMSGEVLAQLMRVLHDWTDRNDADVALVLKDPPDWAAAQAARRQYLLEMDRDPWADALSPATIDHAERLAARAAIGDLVVFMGAGVGVSANIPTWRGFLARIAEKSGLTYDERERLAAMDVLDQAQILAQCFPAGVGGIARDVARETTLFGVQHALVAGLPVREAITTNYDELFEDACHGIHRPVSVLPYAPAQSGGRWLLKLHGCVNHPEDIVLTRESYLRYAERNAALSGIVQSMLITRHMLFVGFSLRDDNFHRIVDAVRRASAGVRTEMGTATMLTRDPLFERMWARDLGVVHLSDWNEAELGGVPGEDRGRYMAAAGRNLELMLDLLAYRTSSSAHLLHERFKGLLSPEDRALRAALEALREARKGAKGAAGWPLVEQLLKAFGDQSR